jgi:hypothetical protein
MWLAQTTDEMDLRHHTRAVLEAIHSVFPLPLTTSHDGDQPSQSRNCWKEMVLGQHEKRYWAGSLMESSNASNCPKRKSKTYCRNCIRHHEPMVSHERPLKHYGAGYGMHALAFQQAGA